MLALLSLCAWSFLFFAHGFFWRSRPQLLTAAPPAITSLLDQDYGGKFQVFLIDDNSTDGTAERAGSAPNLQVIRLDSKPPGWSGKLWALHQGVTASCAPIVLLTDADIVHQPAHLASLLAKLLTAQLDMVSEMVRLNCSSLAERLLVPAFVYFFQMLYPFGKVNDPRSTVAAAAGGTILLRREALERIGGIAAIKDALIDDVALAKEIKRGGPIFLAHSELAASIRPYPGFADIWRMISRTAFTQLRYSTLMLVLTIAGLTVVWLVPPWEVIFASGWRFGCGLAACVLAAVSYFPTLMRYRRNKLAALALPLIAVFYMAATAASALNYWRGKGASWKSRAYPR
jgi:hopene-associated glycosyltransferase HpnB